MILIGTCILSCGIIALLIPTEYTAVSIAAFVIIGFGCAPIYPCIIHSTKLRKLKKQKVNEDKDIS